MQIGEVIRKHRKIKNITQEEMANILGVTAPAVNKWENGNSNPDIMLLAPIARLLDITLDTLLCFQETLTEEEINHIIYEIDSRLKCEPFEEVFQWAKGKIEQYPNCEQLILQTAVIFDAWRLTRDIPDSEKYNDYINQCYVRALASEDETTRILAADFLFEFYSREEQYEKAEEYLAYYSKQNPERKRKQAVIYSKTNRMNEAYKTYEELLFSGYQMINMIFHSLYMLVMRDKNMEKAHMFAEKQRELANLFEVGEYHAVPDALDLATVEKDVKATIEIMERLIASLDSICDFTKSALYEHMEFRETGKEFSRELHENLLTCFRDEETYDYMKKNQRWKELVRQ
ncbi:MAG: helix-turn-helix transcriptional regulator [Lacrimispora sp.]|uniref:helix-turn-helix domain-containing protein n=1 Tax=Lacrimispora sp. TaxID=2719234 RepID=UPI0039E5BF45